MMHAKGEEPLTCIFQILYPGECIVVKVSVNT